MIKEKNMGGTERPRDIISDILEAKPHELDTLMKENFSGEELEELLSILKSISLPIEGQIGMALVLNSLISGDQEELYEQVKDRLEYYRQLGDFYREVQETKGLFKGEVLCLLKIEENILGGMDNKKNPLEDLSKIKIGIQEFKELYNFIQGYKSGKSSFSEEVQRQVDTFLGNMMKTIEIEKGIVQKWIVYLQNIEKKPNIILVRGDSLEKLNHTQLFSLLFGHKDFPSKANTNFEELFKKFSLEYDVSVFKNHETTKIDAIILSLSKNKIDSSTLFKLISEVLITGKKESLLLLKKLVDAKILTTTQALLLLEPKSPTNPYASGFQNTGVSYTDFIEIFGIPETLLTSITPLLQSKGVKIDKQVYGTFQKAITLILKIESGGYNIVNSVTGRAAGYFQFLPTDGRFEGRERKTSSFETALNRLKLQNIDMSAYPGLQKALQIEPPKKYDPKHGEKLQKILLSLSAEEQTILAFFNLFGDTNKRTLPNGIKVTPQEMVISLLKGNEKESLKWTILLYAIVHHTAIDGATMLSMGRKFFSDIPDDDIVIKKIEEITGVNFVEFRPGYLYKVENPKNEKVIIIKKGVKIWNEMMKIGKELQINIHPDIVARTGKNIKLGEAISVKKGENGAYEVNIIGIPNRLVFKFEGENPPQIKVKYIKGNIGDFITNEINRVPGWPKIEKKVFFAKEFEPFFKGIRSGSEISIKKTEKEFIISTTTNPPKSITVKIA